LKPQNILLELENPSDTISKSLDSVPRRTTEGPNGATVPLQEAIHTPPVCQMTSPRVRIIDFGVSSWRERHLSDMIQPLQLRAPEVTVGAPWDTGVDIWSLGFLEGLLGGQVKKRSSLERMLNGKVKPYNKPSDMSEKELGIFVDFLKGMLEIDPTKRKSAAQLLQHEWLS
ncbi:hypothetical protein E4U40_000163, partial [Claviceps sp. LM458 group G5]